MDNQQRQKLAERGNLPRCKEGYELTHKGVNYVLTDCGWRMYLPFRLDESRVKMLDECLRRLG